MTSDTRQLQFPRNGNKIDKLSSQCHLAVCPSFLARFPDLLLSPLVNLGIEDGPDGLKQEQGEGLAKLLSVLDYCW